MTIDVEVVYIDIESFYLFKMGVRKEWAHTSDGGRHSSFRALSATDRKVTRKHGDSLIFRFALVNSKKAPFSFMSIRPHTQRGTRWPDFRAILQCGGAVMKICPAIPSLVKIGQKYRPLCMKTYRAYKYCGASGRCQ